MLRAARSGIIGAIILGLARALGETMAITMVIGNNDNADLSLLAPASHDFLEIGQPIRRSRRRPIHRADVSGAWCLFGITVIINGFARLLIWNMARSTKGW